MVSDFETVAKTFFTHQRLAMLDQTATELSGAVSQLDVSQIDFGPLESATVELEAESRSLKIRGASIDESADQAAHMGRNIQADAAQVEELISTAMSKARVIVTEVIVAAESLEGGAGPQIDKALQEASNILQEIRTRNLNQRQTSAEQVPFPLRKETVFSLVEKREKNTDSKWKDRVEELVVNYVV